MFIGVVYIEYYTFEFFVVIAHDIGSYTTPIVLVGKNLFCFLLLSFHFNPFLFSETLFLGSFLFGNTLFFGALLVGDAHLLDAYPFMFQPLLLQPRLLLVVAISPNAGT